MKRLNDKGAINGLVLTESFTTILLLGALGFGLWAFLGLQDYRNNTDKKIAAAVAVAKQTTASEKDNEFDKKEKSILTSYVSPDVYGSIELNYPKVWSSAISESTDNIVTVNAFFQPKAISIPSLTDSSGKNSVSFALRVQLLKTSYSTVVGTFTASASSGKIKVTPFRAALVPSVMGVRVDGEIFPGKQSSMVILPLRDKTIQVWTESAQYLTDFNNTILPSLKFIP
jgi:hypothetical protein